MVSRKGELLREVQESGITLIKSRRLVIERWPFSEHVGKGHAVTLRALRLRKRRMQWLRGEIFRGLFY